MKNHKGMIRVSGNRMIKYISFDPMYGCLYLKFSDEPVARTHEHSDYVNIDFHKNDEIGGIECLFVKRAFGNMKNIFVELAKTYNRPQLKKVPSELKEDLAFAS